MQLTNTWIFLTSSYMAFVHTNDLDKLADQWEQFELSSAQLSNLALKD